MKKNNNRLILIIVILIVILLILGLVLFINSKSNTKKNSNSYDINNNATELPQTTVYKNDDLVSRHCLNNICIDDATFYYNNEVGRLEYTITNTSNEIKSGYLKMVFGDQNLKIVYNNLKPNEIIKSKSQYMGIEIKDMSNYKLESLTADEISKITNK